MKSTTRITVLFLFALALGAGQFWASTAQAQSSYFTSRGCVNCHAAPTVATCNGCHHHGNSSLKAVTNKTSYAPGETVTATLSGGSKTGWMRAVLYDQNSAQIAISNGNASGMGSSTTFPAALTAPAPMTPGTYTWKMAYFGNLDGSGAGDVHGEKLVTMASFTVASVTVPDTTAPVAAFTLPAAATSLTVPVSSFTATDNVAVTGYLITTSATPPAASAAGWTATAPASVTAVAGSNTFYGWAKDAAGNVSAVKSATVVVTITTADTTAPVVAFTLPATAANLTVPVSSFTATDNVAVTGYLVNKSATPPAASAAGWTATAPASVTAVAGSNTFYGWAKDAAGNVSAVKSATVVVTITTADTTAPVVAFTLPATAANLTVAVSSFTATDNVAVTGYLVNKSATPPAASAAGWTATAPASVTAVAGSNTFYGWAKDAAGNVSAVKSATVVVTITTPDTTAPVVAFTLPATAANLTIPVSSFSATDNVAVTGYLVTTSATPPAASAAGWTATAPASVTAVAGSNTFYGWAKDAAGNVSAVKSATVVVTITTADTTPPTLTLSMLADGSYTKNVTLNVSGTASDAGGLQSVTVNGQAAVVNADGSFSTALSLVAGANVVTVVAADQAANKTTATRTVTYDPAAPVLTVANPADNSTTTQSFITVSGTVSENSTVTVRDNSGTPQTAAMNGNSFSATVNLVSGVNTIDIDATDPAGNTATAKRTVTYDNASATIALAVTSPDHDITTSNQSLILKGNVTDALGRVKVTITMNGHTYRPMVSRTGSFQQRLVFSQSFAEKIAERKNHSSSTTRQYVITVTATDAAGNSGTVTRNVIYDSKHSGNDD